MEEHSSVSEHVVKMSGYVQRLNALECKIPNELTIDRVLQSLPPSFKGFVMNYNMHGMAKTLSEVFVMLKTAEVEIKKEHTLLMVNKTVDFKKSGGKGKKTWKFKKDGKQVAKPKTAKPGPKPGVECFYCKGDGHWKRNCPKYLEDKKAGKMSEERNVYVIYMLLMCTLHAPVVIPGYLIPALLLIFVTHRWSCGIVGAWRRTR